MKTNFFELLAGLSLNGHLQIGIHTAADSQLTVSVLLSPSDPKITGMKSLPPLLLQGSPQELDEHFFPGIHSPMKETSGLIANLEAYQAALEKAKKTAKPEKGGKPEAASEQEDADEPQENSPGLFATDDKEAKAEKKKRYEEVMQQIRELNSQMKYKEAIALLPDALEYPDKAAEIKTRGDELRKRQQVLETLQQEV